jgi:meso-butanediol dehydrogenase / (S,S)-butanediol dehydrogenase / diacetyl reductase
VVNGAGVLSVAPVVDLEAREWRRVLEVNVTGAFLVSQAAARIMIKAARPASIISIASVAGKIGEPGLAHYAASKFALVGFTQALARELAPHHRPQTPDDIALAIAFLHASRSVTGQAINVEGGTVFS